MKKERTIFESKVNYYFNYINDIYLFIFHFCRYILFIMNSINEPDKKVFVLIW